MKAFAELYNALDETNKTNAKIAALRDYFRQAAPEDAAWVVHFLIGLSPHNTYLELGGLSYAKHLIFFVIYYEQDFVARLTTKERDQRIRLRTSQGENKSALAREFGISPQRVDQIVRGRRK